VPEVWKHASTQRLGDDLARIFLSSPVIYRIYFDRFVADRKAAVGCVHLCRMSIVEQKSDAAGGRMHCR
jgi:hypothetical protein